MLLPFFHQNINQIILILVIAIQFSSVQNAAVLNLSEGESCNVNDKVTGICKKSTECDSKSLELVDKSNPVVCSLPIHDLSELVICCPKTETVIDFNVFSNTGSREINIQVPFMASLVVKRNLKQYNVMCGGSIISNRWILTAAHCVYTEVPPTHVIVGVEYQPAINEEKHIISIKQLFQHTNYTAGKWYYDIGLVELNQSIIYDGNTGPICLNGINNMEFIPLQEFWIAGWDKLNLTDSTSNKKQMKLLKSNVYYTKYDDCESYFENDNTLNENIHSYNLCTNNPLGETQANLRVNSGGTLYSEINNRIVLIGINSFKEKSGKMGIYTPVSSFIDWIKKIL